METSDNAHREELLSAMNVAEQEVFFLRAEGADLTDPSMQRILGGSIGSQIELQHCTDLRTIAQTVGYVLYHLLATEERPIVVIRNVLDFIAEREKLQPGAYSGLHPQSA